MITKQNKLRLLIYLYVYLFKYSQQIQFKQLFNEKILTKTNTRKNLFFKKKFSPKTLISKRLFIILKKRKKLKNFKFKKTDKGNFFFKKFFFKTLLKNRKYLKRFFFFNNKKRQKKITQHIVKANKIINHSYEFTLFNILLRSHICLFMGDILLLIKQNFVYLNGSLVSKTDAIIAPYDLIQLKVSKHTYNYIYSCKITLKKRLSTFRLNSWKFFKQKLLKQQQQLKPQKRKTPKYLYLFFLFKLNTPKFLEIDFFTLTVCVLRHLNSQILSTYYLNKFFSYNLFSLYNFKKIN